MIDSKHEVSIKVDAMYYLHSLLVATLVLCTAHYTTSADEKTITGTIYSNNNASLYVNGKLVAVDPVPIAPHNAFNVSFQVPIDQDITFAIEAIDNADDDTGLKLNNRCLGAGGLRAMFSNGVLTNSSWKCYTWHYGPVNWKQCFAAEERAGALKVLPACFSNVSVGEGFDSGCFTRVSPIPDGWADPNFDDGRWEYSTEWDDDYVSPFAWPVFPTGCTDPDTVISPQLDENGDNMTCPSNLNWGESKFIWRPDIDLDNRILCRYTLKQTSGTLPVMFNAVVMLMTSITTALAL